MIKYKTMITEDYIPDWTAADGLREYVSNALDSQSNFSYSIGDGTMTLVSHDVVLPSKILAMGVSSHRNDKNAVGKHGEGTLVGCVPILREGHSLTFYNGSKVWTPKFEWDENLGVSILIIEETDGSVSNNNFIVKYSGTQDIVDQVVQRCLYLQDDLGKVLECDMGRVLMDRSGEVFVGGIWVCNEPTLKHSYDFHPSVMPINRDRKQVSNWDLLVNTSRMLTKVLTTEEVSSKIIASERDLSYFEYSGADTPEICDKVYDLFCEKHGEENVLLDSSLASSKGLSYVTAYGATEAAIKNSPKYQAYVEEVEQLEDEESEEDENPLEILTTWYEDELCYYYNNSSLQESFKEILGKFEERGVKWE